MRLSALILPIYGWREARAIWQRAERLGFHAAYTYDHLAYEGFDRGPWFGAVPTLTAAATATERLRLGTLITSPNFRHPVTLAKDLVALDATVLGRTPWSPAERAEHFEEFVSLLDQLLTHDETTFTGKHYTADQATMRPGCTQQPRVPFTIAATGPRGMRLAARHGQGWVTCPFVDAGHAPDAVSRLIADQLAALDDACTAADRDPATVERVYLTGYTDEQPLASAAALEDMIGRYRDLGLDELVIHWPIEGTRYTGDLAVLEDR